MVVLYMKNIAYEKAFDLVDELKELCREKKNIMCELEQALRLCMEYGEETQYSDSEDYDSDLDDDLYDDDDDVSRRRLRGDKRSLRKDMYYRGSGAEQRRSVSRSRVNKFV